MTIDNSDQDGVRLVDAGASPILQNVRVQNSTGNAFSFALQADPVATNLTAVGNGANRLLRDGGTHFGLIR